MIGRHHARVLRQLDGVEFVAAADPAGDAFGAATNIPIVESVHHLMEYPLDYCVVAVPASLHFSVGSVLADSGVHALIEKPLATDAPTAHALVDAFGAASLVAAVGHTEIYNPAVRALRDRLAYGFLGPIYQIATRRQGPYPSRVRDIGVVKDLATHDIGLVTHVTGHSMAALAARTVSLSAGGHEDLVAAVGQLTDGTVTSHLVNWVSPLRERISVTTGERGCLVADTLQTSLTYYANGPEIARRSTTDPPSDSREGRTVHCEVAPLDPLRVEHEAFRDAVLGKATRIVTLAQGAAIVAVADAVLVSAADTPVLRLEAPAGPVGHDMLHGHGSVSPNRASTRSAGVG
jgi:UDP-N-acetylglucosamine 3-dehydrogenase